MGFYKTIGVVLIKKQIMSRKQLNLACLLKYALFKK